MSTHPRPCVYCGSTTGLTRDHIPPKSLFNKPRPQLITVSACRGCNAGFARDDDYFWLTLSSRAETTRNHEATDASARAIRSLSRKEAEGFLKAFLATVQSVEVRTPTGLYVGESLAYNVSFTRLNRVAARITRGLFAFLTKIPLPHGYAATARALEGFTAEANASVEQLIDFAAGAQLQSIGKTFAYRFRALADDPNNSVCIFDVYEATTFLGLTMRKSNISWASKV